MSITDKQEQKAIEALVREAGSKLMALWPKKDPSRTLKTTQKTDGSFVTEADMAANEVLVKGINALYPGDAILSEEGGLGAELSSAKRIWIMDPLDGTQSFIDGDDDFSILLALSDQDQITYGVMYFPARDLMATALKGQGAHVNQAKLSVSNYPKPRERSVYVRNYEPSPNALLYDQWMDSGLAFLCLANGTLEGVILKAGRHKEWDIAAPLLMVQEAGGRVSDEKGRPLKLQTGKIEYQYLVASNGHAHAAVMKLKA